MLRLGIDPEKLYRATFICQDGLCCCNMALISFRLFRKNLGNLRDFFWANGLPPPLAKNFPYAYVDEWWTMGPNWLSIAWLFSRIRDWSSTDRLRRIVGTLINTNINRVLTWFVLSFPMRRRRLFLHFRFLHGFNAWTSGAPNEDIVPNHLT